MLSPNHIVACPVYIMVGESSGTSVKEPVIVLVSQASPALLIVKWATPLKVPENVPAIRQAGGGPMWKDAGASLKFTVQVCAPFPLDGVQGPWAWVVDVDKAKASKANRKMDKQQATRKSFKVRLLP